MSKKKTFKAKIVALSLTVASVIAGTAGAVAQSVVNNRDPFVLIFRNGKDESTNSNYRLFGRHRAGYKPVDDVKDADLNNKFLNPHFHSWEAELGLGLDNSNPAVQAEQLNWLYYLLFFDKTKDNWKSDKEFAPFVASKDADANTKASTFDGIRIDCGDGIDDDVLGETAQLENDIYNRTRSDADANDHLSFSEGYGPLDQEMVKKYFHSSSLDYDDSFHYNMNDDVMWFKGKAPKLNGLNDNSMTDWTNDQTENVKNPNITYSQNHDNFRVNVAKIAGMMDSKFTYKKYDDNSQKLMYKAYDKYYKNLTEKDKTWKGKQISPKNQITLYADMLTNKDTVPIVFYGDIFEGHKDYMSTPSPIAQPIMDILSARSQYMAGGQQRQISEQGNGHIMTNVRFGDGYFEDTSKGLPDYSKGKNSGIVTVYSNDQNLKSTDLKVYVGLNHKGQQYTNLIDTTSDKDLSNGLGLTLGKAADKSKSTMGISDNPDYLLSEKDKDLTVNEDGYLIIPKVKGVNMPFVNGYLSMWVPDVEENDHGSKPQNIYVTENKAKGMNSYKNSANKDIFNSNAALDSHVIYQDFATDMPYQGWDDQEKDCYAELKIHAEDIAKSGVTDIWMAPPYISPSNESGPVRSMVANYGYGYMMSDRYNLGEGDTPSKYGTSGQLVDATAALHAAQTKLADEGLNNRGLKLIVDYVPHQIIGGDLKENVTFDEYDGKSLGSPIWLTKKAVTRELETKTSDKNFQFRFGGAYLQTMKDLFPDIFDNHHLSTGQKLPYKDEDRIRQWSAKYEVALPAEFGIDLWNDSNPLQYRKVKKQN